MIKIVSLPPDSPVVKDGDYVVFRNINGSYFAFLGSSDNFDGIVKSVRNGVVWAYVGKKEAKLEFSSGCAVGIAVEVPISISADFKVER